MDPTCSHLPTYNSSDLPAYKWSDSGLANRFMYEYKSGPATDDPVSRVLLLRVALSCFHILPVIMQPTYSQSDASDKPGVLFLISLTEAPEEFPMTYAFEIVLLIATGMVWVYTAALPHLGF